MSSDLKESEFSNEKLDKQLSFFKGSFNLDELKLCLIGTTYLTFFPILEILEIFIAQ